MKEQKLIAPDEKLYRCCDVDCQAVISESYRLRMTTKDSDGQEWEFYKCPFCRAKLLRLSKDYDKDE
jgi:hypothetical protein